MISAVVLAAGLSTRMGRTKLALPVDGRPILARVLEALRHSKVDEVVVVLGADAEAIKKVVSFERERLVVNAKYADGMSSSLRLGLQNVNPRADAALIVLGDLPFLSVATVNKVLNGYLEEHAPVVVPVHEGTRGNPVLFARTAFPEVMKVMGDAGAKSVASAYGDRVLEVPIEGDEVLFDVDTPSDYERASSRQPRRRRSRAGA